MTAYFGEAGFAGGGDGVELSLAAIFGSLPDARDKFQAFEAMESGVEGAVFDLQKAVGGGVHVGDDAEAMLGRVIESLEDEEFETAVEVIDLLRHDASGGI